jgi:isoleucyl-tRNA synthetase
LYPFCFDCNGLPTKKLANKEHIFDQSEIIKFAENKSEMYSDLFAKIGMGWSKHQYHTFQGKAITLSAISFDDLKSKGLAYKAVRDYYWCPITKESVSQSEIDENGC